MSLSRIRLKAIVSALLAIAVASVFPLSSVTAQSVADGKKTEVLASPLGSEGATGTLIQVKGDVRINGNTFQTGATVLSASRIVTGSDGLAVIDLGLQGRVEIRDDTTVTLSFAPGYVHVKTECERTEVEVTRGVVDVKSPEIKAILAGEDETYDGSVEATTAGSANFSLDCGVRRPAYIFAGWWGVAGLVAVGAAIATGVIVGGPSGRPRVSPVI